MLSGIGKVLAALENHAFRSNPADWVVLDAKLDQASRLPWELKYLFSLRPSHKGEVQNLLERGHALGFGMDREVPPRVGSAVGRVSELTQEGLSNFWLERLLRYGQYPLWSEADECDAKSQGVDLREEINILKDYGIKQCRFALVSTGGEKIHDCLESLKNLNEDLGQVALPRALLLLRSYNERLHYGFNALLMLFVLAGSLCALSFFLYWPNGGLLLAGLMPSFVLGVKQTYRLYVRSYHGLSGQRAIIVQSLVMVLSGGLVTSGVFMSVPLLFSLGAVVGPVYAITHRFYKVLSGLKRLADNRKLPVWQSKYGMNLLAAERGPLVRMIGLVLGFVIMTAIMRVPGNMADGLRIVIAVWLPLLFSLAFFKFDLIIGHWYYLRGLKRLWRQAIVLTEDGW